MIMATYKQIQKYVKEEYGFKPKTCWIAHVKEMAGLPVKKAWNRKSEKKRENPCPDSKVEPIMVAFRHFGIIDRDGSFQAGN